MTVPATDYAYPVVEPSRPHHVRWLALLIVLVLAGGAGAGTFASFSGSTANTAAFTTGVLTMSNKVNAGATCYSSGTTPTNQVSTDVNANDCPGVYNLATQKPGDNASANLDIRNEGDVNGSDLQVYAAAACAGTTADGPGNFHGTGDLCPLVRLTVQEFASPAARTSLDPTGGTCWFGGNQGPGNLCAFSGTKTVGGFSAFTLGSPLTLGAFPAGVTRYFRIAVELDPSAPNAIQGRSLTSKYVWRTLQ